MLVSLPAARASVLRLLFAVAWVVLGAACGRIGFDLAPLPISSDAEDGSVGGGEAGAPSDNPDAAPEGDGGTPVDGGDADATARDAAPADAGGMEAGNRDASPTDAAGPDAGSDGGGADTGTPEGSPPDCQATASDDTTCNGVDDDCDGAIDEDYTPQATSCGTGACGATGTASCVDGTEIDSCQPGVPAASDPTCDGVDDDCDGDPDDDYVSRATSCGVGACSATGATSCVDGRELNDCAPGAPAANDASCNGVDDDCSGTADEDYVPSVTSCGVGACAGTGTLNCIAGSEVDSCDTSAPGTGDASCDGVDDDCNGTADEDYVETPTQCGQGACAATGSWVCDDGGEVNTCTPGAPLGADDNSGVPGVDDDCDGSVDEDVVCNDPPMVLGEGAHFDVAISPECTVVTARIWGGGGAAGQNAGFGGDGGDGGGGGYAERTFTISGSSSVDVFVGEGGAGCTGAGVNDGSSSYAGGRGGSGALLGGSAGADGADRAVAGGGGGGDPSSGSDGGDGYYGGGGGGSGNPLLGSVGNGGGGGAATVVRVDGSLVAAAGGGGGGGGASGELILIGNDAGRGGAGCSESGRTSSSQGGGGGGGGVCIGDAVQQASGRNAHDPGGELPSGAARGGNNSCGGGGDGYAILSFSR